MHRFTLLNTIQNYEPFQEEGLIKERFLDFVKAHSDCFERSCKYGHITGSSFILSPDKNEILLCFHRKLKMWMQLGGHADGETDVFNVAQKEAFEESGLLDLESNKIPIDLDIHLIPKNSKDEQHFHFDVRYLFHSQSKDFVCSEESIELRWVPLVQIHEFSKEISILRSLKKIAIEK